MKVSIFSQLALIFCLMSGVAQAETFRVNNVASLAVGTGGHTFTSIQAAVNAASNGDTIHIEGSVTPYNEAVTINKPLVVIGPGYFLNMTAESQFNKESAKITGNIIFAHGSAGSTLAGVEQQTSSGGYNQSAFTITGNTAWNGNRIIIRDNNIRLISCKLIYVELDNAIYNDNPTGELRSITIQRCLFNPGMVSDSRQANGGEIRDVVFQNCFFRNSHATAAERLVIRGMTGKQSGWRISNCTFYHTFTITLENTIFANNLFYIVTAGEINANAGTNQNFVNNVANIALTGTNAVNLWNLGANNSISYVGENQWFTMTGGNQLYGMFFTSANSSSPQRDPNNPSNITAERGMYGGGNPYAQSGLFRIPTVYDIAMDNEVGDQFEMIIRARTR